MQMIKTKTKPTRFARPHRPWRSEDSLALESRIPAGQLTVRELRSEILAILG